MTRSFDPDHALGEGIYGLPYTPEESEVVLVPVPFEATASFGAGTAQGPRAILDAAPHLDLLDREAGRPYERGIAMLPIPEEVARCSREARALAEPILRAGEAGDDPALQRNVVAVNALCEQMNVWVYETSRRWLERGKLVGVVGGDHSAPYGLIRALSERHPGMGILHIDAHSDLRDAFEGFTWSHASIMHNVVERLPGVAKLVQVAIRDYCDQELDLIRKHAGRIVVHYDTDLQSRLMDGEPWGAIAQEIVEMLPPEVYFSVDIDGLDPSLCPHTGTPVPGGLSLAQATRLFRDVASSGRRVVGFDLVEVAPDPTGATQIDGVVGARLLYVMMGHALRTR